jgi:hypothetical protein
VQLQHCSCAGHVSSGYTSALACSYQIRHSLVQDSGITTFRCYILILLLNQPPLYAISIPTPTWRLLRVIGGPTNPLTAIICTVSRLPNSMLSGATSSAWWLASRARGSSDPAKVHYLQLCKRDVVLYNAPWVPPQLRRLCCSWQSYDNLCSASPLTFQITDLFSALIDLGRVVDPEPVSSVEIQVSMLQQIHLQRAWERVLSAPLGLPAHWRYGRLDRSPGATVSSITVYYDQVMDGWRSKNWVYKSDQL